MSSKAESTVGIDSKMIHKIQELSAENQRLRDLLRDKMGK